MTKCGLRCILRELTSKSSRVRRLFCACASCLLRAYSAQTRCESMNSLSHGCSDQYHIRNNPQKMASQLTNKKCKRKIEKYAGHLQAYLNIAIKIWNQLVFFMTHSTPEVSYTNICLLAISQITLWDQYVAHRQHAKSSNFFWRVENDRRKSETQVNSNLVT